MANNKATYDRMVQMADAFEAQRDKRVIFPTQVSPKAAAAGTLLYRIPESEMPFSLQQQTRERAAEVITA